MKKNGTFYDVKFENNVFLEKGQKMNDYDSFYKKKKNQLTDHQTVEHYEGSEVNGLKEGHGKIVYTNGDEYEGDFKNNLKDGFGTYKFKNGDIYEGQF